MPDTPPPAECGGYLATELSPWARRGLVAFRTGEFLSVLYVFLLSITLVGAAFLAFGEGFAAGLISSTSNPLVGLFIGILATSIIQSSSATTSIIVGTAVAIGPEQMPVFLRNAIPIIMGANIGTTVTAVLVSLGHIRRKEEFRRAFGGALVHEVFKLFTVAVLFPLELATRFLERSACALGEFLWESGACEAGTYAFNSPLKAILGPVAKVIARVFTDPDPNKASVAGAVLLLLSALVLLFGSLWLITMMMRRAVVGRAEELIDRTIGRAPFLALVVGFVLTAIVQSSSAVTSLLVPLAGAGVLTLEQVFPIELGSCLGTTVTGVLASLAVGPAGLAIALTHVIFNLTGILIVYPVPYVRALPVRLARWFAGVAAESKRYAFAYVLGTFFVGPGLLILLARAISDS
jgi:sodium-dependent phosphate cotransporter